MEARWRGFLPVCRARFLSDQTRCDFVAWLEQKAAALKGRPFGRKPLRAAAGEAARLAPTWHFEDVAAALRVLAQLERYVREPTAVRRVLGQLRLEQVQLLQFDPSVRQFVDADDADVPSLVAEVLATKVRRRDDFFAVASFARNAAAFFPSMRVAHLHLVADALAAVVVSTPKSGDPVALRVASGSLRQAVYQLLSHAATRFDDLHGEARVSMYDCAVVYRSAAAGRRLSRWMSTAQHAASAVLKPVMHMHPESGKSLAQQLRSACYAEELSSVGAACLGHRHTLRLLKTLEVAAVGIQRSSVQRAGRAALREEFAMYGDVSGTSCFVRYESEHFQSERVVNSGGVGMAGTHLVAVPLRVRRDTDAEFIALTAGLLAAQHYVAARSPDMESGAHVARVDGLRVLLHVTRPPCLSCLGAMVQMQALGASVSVSFEGPGGIPHFPQA